MAYASKEKRDAYNKQYRIKNRERLSVSDKKYFLENRDRIRAYQKEYREKNRQLLLQADRDRYRQNREEIRERVKANRRQHAELIRAKDRAYYRKNAEKKRANARRSAKAHHERVLATARRYNQSPVRKAIEARYRLRHPEVAAVKKANRRALVRKIEGRCSFAEVRAIWEKQHHKCAVENCQHPISDKSGPYKYHLDHIIPLKLGGTNLPSNLQILCPKHNKMKCALSPEKWAERLRLRAYV